VTEPNNIETWGEIGTPTDLWSVGKSFGEYTPAEEAELWREAVKVLEGFCQVADGLCHEPLILALMDAKVRAEEELERALDHEERPEGVQLTQKEDERLLGLMRRSDALNNACVAVEDWSGTRPEVKADVLAVLTEMRAEAHRNFMVYRREVGLE
jgi:hypothetical protein